MSAREELLAARAGIKAAAEGLKTALEALARVEALLEAAPAAPAAPPGIQPWPRQPIVCVDAGHGGTDPGAHGAQGQTEAALTLAYAFALRDMLQRNGCKVVMTRTTDVFVPLGTRSAISNSSKADAFISVHANSAESKLANGAWVIHDDLTTPDSGIKFANKVYDQLAKLPGVADKDAEREVFPDDSPPVGGRDLAVLGGTRAPAILVELGFLTNEEDMTQLADPVERSKIVGALAAGVVDFLKEKVT